jgi:hypothetical protein
MDNSISTTILVASADVAKDLLHKVELFLHERYISRLCTFEREEGSFFASFTNNLPNSSTIATIVNKIIYAIPRLER